MWFRSGVECHALAPRYCDSAMFPVAQRDRPATWNDIYEQVPGLVPEQFTS